MYWFPLITFEVYPMILILSYDTYEQGTDPVISWLLNYNVPFIKLSIHDLIRNRMNCYLDIKNRDIIVNGTSVKSKVKVVWHRRFMGELFKLEVNTTPYKDQLNLEIKSEVSDLVDYLHTLLEDKPWLTTFQGIHVSKLKMLNVAEKHGLSTPNTRIINNRMDLLDFYFQMEGKLISKPISDSRKSYLFKGDTYVILTNEFTEARILKLSEFFFPALFQEKIEAEFEIRVFYLDGSFYPTAVLNSSPQKNIDKKLDSSSKHTHLVPYQLPAAIEKKLDAFMREVKLNTGCIDLLLSKEEDFVFIEVNPVGQYLAESKVCNYKIEKEIANWLIKQ